MGTSTILQMMHRKATTLGLEERVERVLAYMFFWISGIFFLLFEKNRNVRWHALQSTIVFGILSLCMFAVKMVNVVLSAVFSLIPILGGVLSSVTSFGLGLLSYILLWMTILIWLWLMLMALLRPGYRLPFFGILLPNFPRK
jgi:uncharacterized membrane protein